MGFKSLAEAIILQSMEDLSNPQHREKSKEFFKGEGFKIYAEIAESNSLKKYEIIHLASGRKNGRTTGIHRT